jgi:hypothetical protein
MTINYQKILERYPKLNGMVGGLITSQKIFSSLYWMEKLGRWPPLSYSKSKTREQKQSRQLTEQGHLLGTQGRVAEDAGQKRSLRLLGDGLLHIGPLRGCHRRLGLGFAVGLRLALQCWGGCIVPIRQHQLVVVLRWLQHVIHKRVDDDDRNPLRERNVRNA